MDRTEYRYQSPRQLAEKSTSTAQQHAMGAALRYKREGGDTFPLAKKLATGMTEKQLEDFAGTKHKNLPRHAPKKPRKDEVTAMPRPSLYAEDGRFKGFAAWVAEIEESAMDDNPGMGGEDDDPRVIPDEMDRDDAVVVALQELGLLTKSQIDPERDADTIADAMTVKLGAVRDKLDASDRIRGMAQKNPAVQGVLANRNATIQDLVSAMSSGPGDDDRPKAFDSSMGDDEDDMDQEIQKGRDDDDPFSPL